MLIYKKKGSIVHKRFVSISVKKMQHILTWGTDIVIDTDAKTFTASRVMKKGEGFISSKYRKGIRYRTKIRIKYHYKGTEAYMEG